MVVIMKDYNKVSDEDIVTYVKRSKYRVEVLKSLEDDVLMPKEISIKTGIVTNHISKVLSELKLYDLVECLNPEVRKGRLYRSTDFGLKIINKLK